MARDRNEHLRVDPGEFQDECEIWDWVRAAGVSVQELRRTLIELLSARELV
jgi:hypothetical protein